MMRLSTQNLICRRTSICMCIMCDQRWQAKLWNCWIREGLGTGRTPVVPPPLLQHQQRHWVQLFLDVSRGHFSNLVGSTIRTNLMSLFFWADCHFLEHLCNMWSHVHMNARVKVIICCSIKMLKIWSKDALVKLAKTACAAHSARTAHVAYKAHTARQF